MFLLFNRCFLFYYFLWRFLAYCFKLIYFVVMVYYNRLFCFLRRILHIIELCAHVIRKSFLIS